MKEIKSKYGGWREKKTFILTFLKAELRQEVKSCDQSSGGRKKKKRSLIFLTAPTGSAEREQWKMEKKGKNRSVLLNVSNDHKHINHGVQRLELGK